MLNRKKWQDYMLILNMKDTLLFLLLAVLSFTFAYVALEDLFSALFALIIPTIFSLHAKQSSKFLLKIHNGVVLKYEDVPWLFDVVDFLSAKAGLDSSPELYILNTKIPNAFTTETKEGPILAISAGLIARMDKREIKGVIAHELSHIIHKDATYLKIVQGLYAFVAFLSTLVHISIIFFLPFYLMGSFTLSTPFLLAILIVPSILRLVILALMRNREYAADLMAVNLTEDPEGLALALSKLNSMNHWVVGLMFPYNFSRKTSLLDTHPLPKQRIQRLMALSH